jgi:hypothetical protein
MSWKLTPSNVALKSPGFPASLKPSSNKSLRPQAQAKLNEDWLTTLTDLVAQSPDATLNELRERMKKKRESNSAPQRFVTLCSRPVCLEKRLSEPSKTIR